MPRRWHISRTCPAMSKAICSPSMAQGPAMRKKLPESVFFNRGMSNCMVTKIETEGGLAGAKVALLGKFSKLKQNKFSKQQTDYQLVICSGKNFYKK